MKDESRARGQAGSERPEARPKGAEAGAIRAEEALRKAHEVLESQFAERTAELERANERLRTEIAERMRVEAQQKRLLAAEREQRLRADTLREVTLALTSQIGHQAVLGEILRHAQRIVQYRTANIALLEDGILRAAHWHGYDAFGSEEFISTLAVPLADLRPDAKAVASRSPLVIHDTRLDPDWVVLEETAWIRSYLVAPIRLGDRVLGLLRLDSDRPGQFTDEDSERLQPLVNAAAIALENARLLEEARRRTVELSTLLEATRAISSTLDIEAVLRLIAEQMVNALHVDGCTLSRWDRAADAVVTWIESRHDDWSRVGPGTSFALSDYPVTRAVLETRRPQTLLADDPHADPAEAALMRASGVGSLLMLPLTVGDRVIGLAELDQAEQRRFSAAEIRLCGALSDTAAVAIENARLVGGLEAEVAKRTGEIVVEQQKSRTILRSVDDAIFMADRDMRIRYLNPALTSRTGYTDEDLIGRHASVFWAGAAWEQVEPAVLRAVTQGEVWGGEVTIRRKDGRTYEAAVTAAPVRGSEGNIEGCVFSHHDISRLKELERARSRFMTSVSHELRTPLTNIKLYTNLLQKGLRVEKATRYLQVLEEQADRLSHLVQDILEMTVLDSGRAAVAWAPLALTTLIGDVITRFQSQAEAAGLDLTAEPLPEGLRRARGDTVRLGQALGELVENAVTFTPAGGQVTVCVRGAEEGEQCWITIAVQDTGPGISPEEQKQVFDRFYRGQLAEAGHLPGTGLGLSIAQEILWAHGGRVTVASAGVPDQGSTFTLWIPCSPGR